MKQNNWTWAAIVVLALAVLIFALNKQFPDALQGEGGQMRLVYSLGWLALIGASVIMGWRHNAGLALKQALAWIAIFMLFVVIYSVKDDLMGVGGDLGSRVASSLVTNKPVTASDGTVYLTRRMSGGHFHVDAVVNGHVTSFLIDTGASDVAMSESAARAAGINVDDLVYDQPYQTANGVTMGARVTLDTIQVGEIVVRNVRGSVMKEDGMSLLGMSFLNALGSYEFKGDRLVLRR
ncbi:MAG: retropepsin-like aspartic protease family protein [Parvibaculaceae bacterium]